ncbi:PD-(D/E)XK motif protein [Agrobacterium salinitolerans]|uniref:PD-(D/E)XK motif protein n=1 Tax=Agrobacterium salinitolerans TaxID=1183413 RepID=UPI0020B1CF3F|nr:PD-(D/E)XK motif protein [Agrobacterium salinitolerans]
MSEASPWDQITVPTEDYNVLRLAARMAVPVSGQGMLRDIAFSLELDGDHSLEFRKNQVPVKGLEVDLRAEKGGQRLVLTLEKQADRDLFEALCRTMARALENASNAASSLAIALSHLRRWKTFMSGRSQHLSAEDVRGLFAELTFLIELIGVMGASHRRVERPGKITSGFHTRQHSGRDQISVGNREEHCPNIFGRPIGISQ